MTRTVLAIALTATLLLPSTAYAAQATLQIELGSTGDIERHIIQYDCSAEAPIAITYLNAAPNFLALVPLAEEPEPLVFASVLSASGARYAAGKWVWWTKGTEASLYDTTLGENAAPVLTCGEVINTP